MKMKLDREAGYTRHDHREEEEEEVKRVCMVLDRGLKSAAALAKPVSSAVCSSGDWPGKGWRSGRGEAVEAAAADWRKVVYRD